VKTSAPSRDQEESVRTTRITRHPAVLTSAALAVASLVLAGCTASTPAPSAAPASTAASTGVVKEQLGSAMPSTAPGEELGLWHYVFPPGTQLVPHYHPGWQIARIVGGTLTYSIIQGDVAVTRADGTTETHRGGETIQLGPGDTVVENPASQHTGANDGTVPVELYTSTLLDADEPPAIPLASPTPSPS
jgi:quercetin dioxygenase-like cupin family protein